MTSSMDLSRYRAWCLAQGHGVKTVDKSVRTLRFFERQFDLQLVPLPYDGAIAFLANRREEGVHPKTLNGYVRELNLWSRFSELGWKLTYFRRHAPVLPDLLTEGDEERLRAIRFVDPSVNSRNRAMLLLSLDQGPRREEIQHLRLSDLVDAPGGGKALLIQRGKGDKPRMLFLAPETEAAISTYVETYRCRSHPAALFTTARGAVSYGMMGKIASDIQRAARVRRFTWHRGRHRMIDAMLDRGVPLPAIQEIAGHSRAETTVGYASRRVLRNLTEREVRNFQAKRLTPLVDPPFDRTRASSVLNPPGSSAGRDGSRGVRPDRFGSSFALDGGLSLGAQ